MFAHEIAMVAAAWGCLPQDDLSKILAAAVVCVLLFAAAPLGTFSWA
jgi:hypothetical protein